MPPFNPTIFDPESEPLQIEDVSGAVWSPVLRHDCDFGPDIFLRVMTNLIRNPNINTSWLFRADILHDSAATEADNNAREEHVEPHVKEFRGYRLDQSLVRRLIPRNTRRDNPLDQTCLFLSSSQDDRAGHNDDAQSQRRSLVIYIPHETDAEDLPFYHPKVRGVAHLHEWDEETKSGTISIHYWYFQPDDAHVTKLNRTAQMLLSILYKHGQGQLSGYVKRVQHDVVVPQARFQNKYSELKLKYAKSLVDNWAESTDPVKHVFEDLGIAAFFIELWADMYKDRPFPGFVDIGCGNGLLVHLLLEEGYQGWGFDARARRSWEKYNKHIPGHGDALQKLVLLPTLASRPSSSEAGTFDHSLFHNGTFPRGTFVISNHADELTPWTPILATLSDSPFVMIPCCSHDLTGAKYRAPPPRDKSKPKSAYASLVDWASQIAEDCGWFVETEMLRIPSTRNTALLGRTRTQPSPDIDAQQIVDKYGGTATFFENAVKLTQTGPRGH